MLPLHFFYPHQEHPLHKKKKTCESPRTRPKFKTKQKKKKKKKKNGGEFCESSLGEIRLMNENADPVH